MFLYSMLCLCPGFRRPRFPAAWFSKKYLGPYGGHPPLAVAYPKVLWLLFGFGDFPVGCCPLAVGARWRIPVGRWRSLNIFCWCELDPRGVS